MKFFSASSLAIAFAVTGMANAAAVPAQADGNTLVAARADGNTLENFAAIPDQADDHTLESRAAGAVAGVAAKYIIKQVGNAAVAEAIAQAFKTLGGLGQWNSARERFTKNTVAAMWARRPRNARAAVCYNMAYRVSRPSQMTPVTSVEFRLGNLNTDYDCFYMWGPDNHFNSQGDGGYINLATITQGNCSFDKKTSDIYCA
ncbi:uncharacterized protein PFL1_01517 [Pseudozyma flocculosa PF-1]|uniref:DUF7888 domain-containing protein n=1 Tax=Pseudozyma flocculosa TaxID=84751 RepID=A0A5C3FBS4_9BASI|nr:uncharacterized protein PFL1_01517 [Pseudozyma flocculosa PF-1]EPQ31333.1 hypothetical protein PFL1_01517 [Pseudozyma flocculosa PF-1]SPO41798.1 uncharacterized protein PSFLO_07280 [Pseudozyma flocculosa]